MTELRLRAADQVGSLYRWLLADVDMAECVQGMGPPERDDDMGPFEVINTVVANGPRRNGRTRPHAPVG